MKRIIGSLLGLLLWANCAIAAPVNLGTASAGGGGITTVQINPVVNAVSAGVLVMVFCYDSNIVTPSVTVTDSKSNTYTAGPFSNTTFGIHSFYSFVTTPLTTSDTISCTDSAATGFNQFYLSAVSASGYNAYDSATANANSNGFASTFSVTGAGAAAVANEIYFGFSFTNSTFSGTPSGWATSPPNTPLAGAFLAGWQINSGTSALTWNGTTTGSQFTDSLILSFKPSAVVVTPTRMLLGVGQ